MMKAVQQKVPPIESHCQLLSDRFVPEEFVRRRIQEIDSDRP